MTRLLLAALVIAGLLAIIVTRRRRRLEHPWHWQEPEDGYAPGELPQTDPRVTDLQTYLRGWQGGQVVYTRVGREWEQ